MNHSAQEYSFFTKDFFNKTFCSRERDIAEQAFLAGISFAERWIDVNDELPEKNIQVLVKYYNSKEKQYRYTVDVITDILGKWIHDIYPNFKVTHWRHINIK